MKTEVLFEKKENKLEITIDKNADYKDIKNKIKEILDASLEIFDGVESPIIIQGRRFQDNEEQEVLGMFKEKTELEVIIEKPKKMGLCSIDDIFNKDTTISNTKVIYGTIRSGQRIEFEGSIVILGDINGGAEVVAEENIIVVGNIRGFAHAGAKGNRSSFIAANTITPTQLRIADVIMKDDIEVKENGNNYMIAKINLGEIVIEK